MKCWLAICIFSFRPVKYLSVNSILETDPSLLHLREQLLHFLSGKKSSLPGAFASYLTQSGMNKLATCLSGWIVQFFSLTLVQAGSPQYPAWCSETWSWWGGQIYKLPCNNPYFLKESWLSDHIPALPLIVFWYITSRWNERFGAGEFLAYLRKKLYFFIIMLKIKFFPLLCVDIINRRE